MKKFRIFIILAIVFQLLNGTVHSISLFVTLVPANDTEKQMLELMNTYKMDQGAGFAPTFMGLFKALSACFTWLHLLAGLINWYLLRKKISFEIFKGVLGINLIFFTANFAMILYYTFLIPIILSGLVFLSLLAAYLTVPRSEATTINAH